MFSNLRTEWEVTLNPCVRIPHIVKIITLLKGSQEPCLEFLESAAIMPASISL
jgi:hypothetical protein